MDAVAERADDRYPAIGSYALIGDCHSAALVCRSGAIDWCCMPRFDSPSIFGRLLDWERGGHCSVVVDHPDVEVSRRYLGSTMVLETTYRTAEGELRLVDFLAMTEGGARSPRRRLVRLLECTRGSVGVEVTVAVRFDYGGIRPWLRHHDDGAFSAIGGSEGLVVTSDLGLGIEDRHDLRSAERLSEGGRRYLSIAFEEPELIDRSPAGDRTPRPSLQAEGRAATAWQQLDETLEWWNDWRRRRDGDGAISEAAERSALVLKSLVHAPTGAIVAAPTTSLPEQIGGERNWDYRYSWIRDSWFTVLALADVGFRAEAEGFRRFVERSAAGSASELQLVYGVDGAHRLPEEVIDDLEGYRRSAPVRIGNAAGGQTQLDMYGYLLELAWEWAQRGHRPEGAYWEFLVDIVDLVAERWHEPDHGIWEVRNERQHFVHSKVMCWAALDGGIRLSEVVPDADAADVDGWRRARDEIRRSVERHGVSSERGCFVQAYGTDAVDAALLLLPTVRFVEPDDPIMVATVDAVIEDLDEGGLIRRYLTADGLGGQEGTFVACTFWLVERLAAMGRREQAEEYYARAMETANDVGLFPEEYDASGGIGLGNFPQALSHLAHLSAERALAAAGAPPG